MEQNNKVKVYTSSLGGNLEISVSGMKQTIEATNNRARYYAEQSLKYRDEAKMYAENAQYYADQNADVSKEDLFNLKLELQKEIAAKQDVGNYALKEELPINVSELKNDVNYVNDKQLLEKVPDQTGCTGQVLITNGEKTSWSGINSFQLFDCKLTDRILDDSETKGWALQGTYVYKDAIAGSRYGYPDFYTKCLEEYNGATDTETVNGKTVKVHSSGHKFYDIADKTGIDEFFNTMGSAWFYGVDTENERIFLPRNNYFDQATSDVSEVGQSVEAGLPNITGTFSRTALAYSASGCFTASSGGSQGFGNNMFDTASITLNASKSNAIYGNSDTVQPNAVKKLLYICVGNTESQSTITDVVDVTTTENDTLPLGYHFYQAGAQPSVSYLKSQGQWNDGNVYTTFYNEFVNKIGQDFASGKIVEVTDTYTDYDLVINQDDMIFRLPLLDGSEDLVNDKYTDLTLLESGSTYTAPANGWVVFGKTSSASSQFVYLKNETNGLVSNNWSTGTPHIQRVYIPVKKNDIFSASYTATGAIEYFRFIYAQGNGSLYFKVANAVQNFELLDAGEVLEAVNNVIPNNASLIAGYCMPDYSSVVTVTYPLSSNPYTAPCSGMLCSWGKPSNTAIRPIINGVKQEYLRLGELSGGSGGYQGRSIYLSKGDVIYFDASYNVFEGCVFYPLKGAK